MTYLRPMLLAPLCCLSLAMAAFFLVTRIPEALDGRSPADFPNYYFAGRRIIEGRPLYGSLQHEVKEALGWEYGTYPADPPATLLLLAPLALLNYQTAWWLLFCFSVVCMSAAILITGRELRLSWPTTTAMTIISLGSTPFLFMLYRNHFEALLVLLGVLGWICLRRNRESYAGVFWGLAAALKLFPLLWLAMLLPSRYRRGFISGLITFLTLTVLSTFVCGLENFTTFVLDVIPQNQQWMATIGNYSLLSVAWALFGSLGAKIVVVAAILLALPLLIGRKDPDTLFGQSVSASLIFSPLAWLNYLVLAHPIAAIVAQHFPSSKGRGVLLFSAAILPLFIYPEIIELSSETGTVLASSAPLISLFVLFTLSTILAFRNRSD